eukprot:symbB.v1.2.005585.t1/scaffold326.1/size228935/7
MILVLAWSRQAMSDALGGIKLFFSGALLVRLQIPPIEGKMQQNSSRGDEFSAHVDKANVASYDWSALLYLSTVGEDFEGGELLFLDDDIDSQLAPKAGQLVFFSSGLENVHRVRPMTFGRRLVAMAQEAKVTGQKETRVAKEAARARVQKMEKAENRRAV